jgi:hypothetical protein
MKSKRIGEIADLPRLRDSPAVQMYELMIRRSEIKFCQNEQIIIPNTCAEPLHAIKRAAL